jgi:hypothetical protein
VATEFVDLHRKFWPGFELESEVRPMFDPGQMPPAFENAKGGMR